MNSQLNYLACLSLGLLLLLTASTAFAQKPVLVSVAPSDTRGHDLAGDPAVSANGRFIAYRQGSFLSPFLSDIFVRDLQSGTTTLVSVNRTGSGGGNGNSFNPSISGDGRFVAFDSNAPDLVATDTNGVRDVFVRDLQLGITTLVSTKRAVNDSANGESFNASISRNGNVVVFTSIASDIVNIDHNDTLDVFARNLQTGVNSILSCNEPCTASGNGPSAASVFLSNSKHPTISDDGGRVVFESVATNLLSISDTNGQPDVFMRDLVSGSTRLISVNSAGTASNGASTAPVISGNGQRVFFQTTGANVTANDVGAGLDLFVRDLQTNTTSLVSVTSTNTGIDLNPDALFVQVASDDGRYVIFQTFAKNLAANDSNNNFDVFRRDLQTNTTSLVTVTLSGGSSEGSFGFVGGISADGRFVSFVAGGAPFTTIPGNIGLVTDVFVRDMNAGATTLISTNAAGTSAAFFGGNNGLISDDGRFVIFETVGSDLVLNVTSGFNVFITAVNGRVEFETTALSVNETAGNATVTVKRNGSTSEALTVQYTNANGTAKANSDFSPVSGSLTFAVGETSKTIVAPIINDPDVELQESLLVVVSDFNAGAEKAASLSAAVLSIVDNDLPKISIDDITVVEGNTGPTRISFTLTLSAPTSKTVTVFATSKSGTALINEDFNDFDFTNITFPPGITSRPYSGIIKGDTAFEDDETFTVELFDPVNATIERNQGKTTIKNDDPLPSIAIHNVTLSEAPAGTTQFNFAVTASNPSGTPITVQFATANGTATAGSDYVQAAGTFTLAPFTTTDTIPVTINGDLVTETSETFFVNLTSPNGATLADSQALGTILNYQFPILLTEEGSQRAAAIETLLGLRDPFRLNQSIFGFDGRTRITLFAQNIPPVPADDLLRVTVNAEDEQGNSRALIVEFIGPVTGVDNLTQIIVRLPEHPTDPRELKLKLIVLGGASNTAPIRIAGP